MGLLRRLFGGGEEDKPEQDPSAPASEPARPASKPPPKKKAAPKPKLKPVDPADPAARLDAARDRLREEIPPIDDED